jgi:hypothetical protein
LNNYFDKIFVINLPGAKERKGNNYQSIKWIEFRIFFGADKKQFSIEELANENIYTE